MSGVEWAAGDRVLDHFVLERPLSTSTWLAKDTRSNTTVVVRFDRTKGRSQQRSDLLARLRSLCPGVAPSPIAFGEVRGGECAVRKWVGDASLDLELASVRGAGVGRERFEYVVRALAESLARLHRAGFSHGLLSPSNVVLSSAGACLLSLDHVRDEKEPMTWFEDVCGYLSFRVARGAAAKPPDDLWSLGLIAYECLTGTAYWTANSQIELLRTAISAPIEAPSVRASSAGINAPLPRGFDDWFLACVTRDDARAYSDGSDALDALEALVLRGRSGFVAPVRAPKAGGYEGSAPLPCLEVSAQPPIYIGPQPCLSPVQTPPRPCLNIAPPQPCLMVPQPCLNVAPPQPCLKVAPRGPSVLTRLRAAWDERREAQAQKEREQANRDAQNAQPASPYRGVVLRPGEAQQIKKRRRVAFVGVAVSAALIAWWLARRC